MFVASYFQDEKIFGNYAIFNVHVVVDCINHEASELDYFVDSPIITDDMPEEMKEAMEGMLSAKIEEKVTGTCEVRETFKISKVGTIAGCFVLDGKLNRNSNVLHNLTW